MGLEGFLDPVTSSWQQFSKETICLASSKCTDSLMESLSSSRRELKASSAVISHSFVLDPVLVPRDDVAGSVCKENAWFK